MIKSALQSSLTNDVKYRSVSAGAVPSNEYLIQTIEVGATALSSIVFDNLAQYAGIYRHLVIHLAARVTQSSEEVEVAVRANDISTSSYSWHYLRGNGSTVTSAAGATQNIMYLASLPGSTAASGVFGSASIDILDPFNSNKNTTFRSLSGNNSGSPRTTLYSGLYQQTTAISSISLYPQSFSGNFASGSRFSLYGVTV